MAAEGITVRHKAACRTRNGGQRCNCTPSYRAQVTDPDQPRRGKIRRTFQTETGAVNWRRDMLTASRAPRFEDDGTVTVGEACDELLARISDGRWLSRSGREYRPATIRDYRQVVRDYVKPMIGHLRIAEVRRRDVQDFVDALRAAGLSASTVHNRLDVLRVVFKLAVDLEWRETSPCHDLRLPAVRSRRPRVVDHQDARRLLDALPGDHRPLWAALFYAGLRIGEARALRWRHVDFAAGEIRVRHGWDDIGGEQDAKTDAGHREIPLVGELRTILAAHKLAAGGGPDDLCFGRTATQPFVRSTVRRVALQAWGWQEREVREDGRRRKQLVRLRDDALEPVTPHGARHTCASYLIAAGVDDKVVQTVIGHTDIRTTRNIYQHLLKGSLDEARTKLDAYLEARS